MNKRPILFITFLLLCLLFSIGIWFAAHRFRVIDEGSSLHSVRVSSYGDILLGKIKNQANSFPLFFLIFKPFGQNLDPDLWEENTVDYNIRCRIVSVLCISLTMCLLFYYFACSYSLGCGFYSLIISLTKFTIWFFFALARPYPLWILLTAVQGILFFDLMKQGYTQKTWNSLTLTHMALAMTHPFTLFYISSLSVALAIFIQRDWKKYIFMTGVPALLWGFYMLQFTPAYRYGQFTFPQPVHEVIFANFAKERILIFVVLLSTYFFLRYPREKEISSTTRWQLVKESRGIIALVSMMLLATFIIVLILKVHPGDPHPDDVPSFALNYITFLTPVGIMTMTYGSYFLMRFFRNTWIRWILVLSLSGVILLRGSIEWRHAVDIMTLKGVYSWIPFK